MNFWFRLCRPACKAALLWAAFCGTAHAATNVLSNRYDNNRTAANVTETALSPSTVSAASFGKLWSYPVDGAIFAQPLYVQGVTVAGATTARNVLYVATMHDVVYAFDADAPGAPLWTHDFRATGITPGTPFDNETAGDGMGIISTPVIDAASNKMYLVAETMESGAYVQRLHAVDIRSGIDLGATVIAGSAKGQTFDPKYHSQRPGLALAGGQVWLAFGSTIPGDFEPWHGWVMTYDANSLVQTGVFVTATGGGGGVWHSGGAPAVDSAGNVYYLTGNGTGQAYDGVDNLQESLLQFTYSGGLKLVNWYTSSKWQWLDNYDLDLTVSAPMLVPGTDLLAFGGKVAVTTVLHTTKLGKLTANDAQVAQSIQTGPVIDPGVNDGNRIIGLAYWQRPSNPKLYIWPGTTRLTSYTFNGNTFAQDQQNAVDLYGEPGAALSVSANGSTAGSGILWVAHNQAAGRSVGQPAVLEAYDADNIGNLLWSSTANLTQDDLGSSGRFVIPMVNNGRVYMATCSGSVRVYGLLSSLPPPAGAVSCAADGQTCAILGGGTATVWYGANGKFLHQTVNGSVLCASSVFGDPGSGTSNACSYELKQPPAASLTQPLAGVKMISSSVVTLAATATATSSGGAIAKVSFYDGGALLSSSTASPYTFTWSNPAAGTHTLTAVATDSTGTTGTSPALTVVSVASNGSPPAGAISCSSEGGSCNLPSGAVADVWYGAGTSWNVKSGASGSVLCTNASFGDPAYGTYKACYYPQAASPVVSITQPLAGVKMISSSVVTLAATAIATSSGGAIAKVSYYDGATLLGSSTASPYAVTWSNPAAGTHTLTAVATDSTGNTGTSSALTVVAVASNGSPPSGAISCSSERGTCTLPSGTVADVWYGAGTSWNVKSGVSGSLACANESFGDPAYGTRKGCYYPASAPSVSLTQPLAGVKMASGSVVSLAATATAPNSRTIAKVSFYDGATLLGTSTAAPYTFTWWNPAAGTHTLTAVATDSAGTTGTSSALTVSVASNGSLPAGAVYCSSEGGTCALPAGMVTDVWYGADSRWNVKSGASGSLPCANESFGDPAYGTFKGCYYPAK